MSASRLHLPVTASALLIAPYVASAQVQDGGSAVSASTGILQLGDYLGDLWEHGYVLGDFGGSRTVGTTGTSHVGGTTMLRDWHEGGRMT